MVIIVKEFECTKLGIFEAYFEGVRKNTVIGFQNCG